MTTVERAAALLVIIVPPFAVICAGGWKVFLWLMGRHDATVKAATAAAPIVQGQVIPTASDAWATRAYEGAIRERDDALADHARSIDLHRACHDAMRDHGIHVPDDH